MLKVCFQAITTGQKIWSRFPAPRQTIREMSGQLGMNAAKIVEVESDGSVFAPYLIGKEVPPEKGYKEVDFLERRMECLTRKEQQVFQEALEMEHPETLEEMVNLSCNLDKFELLEDGKVIRTGEVLDTVYDSEPLPDVGYEKDSVFWLRLDSPFYKRDYGRWYPLSLPADEEKLEELLEGFLSNLERGFYDDGGNWVDVTPVETDWVDEDDCVMKAKMAVQIKVVCKYGIYKDVAAWTSPEGTEMELTTGKDEDGQQ